MVGSVMGLAPPRWLGSIVDLNRRCYTRTHVRHRGVAMFADADHEVIDSPEALFRHLYEEHGVEEARDLDLETAPLQFWLRRHADLERAQRAARRPPEPPADRDPEPEARSRPEPRPQPPPRSQSQPPPAPRRLPGFR